MCYPSSVADLALLESLAVWMRSQHPPVLHARLGDAELWLDPPASVPSVGAELPALSRAEEHRRSIEALLWSSGADPSPFLGAGE